MSSKSEKNLIIYAICGLMILYVGCSMPQNQTNCLRNVCSGFYFWPVPNNDGDSINIGNNLFTLTTLHPGERKIIQRLRSTFVSIDAWGVGIGEFIDKLNEMQRTQNCSMDVVPIRLDIPVSWDTKIVFDDVTAQRMGYDKGFETSARKYLPCVKIYARNESVYDVLDDLSKRGTIGLSISFTNGEVQVTVDDFKMEDAYHYEGM